MARSTATEATVAACRVWAAAQKLMSVVHMGGGNPVGEARRADPLSAKAARVQHNCETSKETIRTSSGCQLLRFECSRRRKAICGTSVSGAATVNDNQTTVELSISSAHTWNVIEKRKGTELDQITDSI